MKIVWQDATGPGNTTYATQYPIWLIVHEQLGDPALRTCVAQLDNSTESQANATLISAAPDLFAVLQNVYWKIRGDSKIDPALVDQVRAALRLARPTSV